MDQAIKKKQELRDNRTIEAQLVAHDLDLIEGGGGSRRHPRLVTRDELYQHEHRSTENQKR